MKSAHKKAPQCILLANSNLARRGELRRSLEKNGFTAIETNNGVMAEQLAQQKRPDMVIAGTELELRPALQLCANLKQHRLTKDIPVIVCEDSPQTPARQKLFRKSGIDAYVRYPAEPHQVLPVVHNLAESLVLQRRNFSLQQNISEYMTQLRAVNASATRFVPAEFLKLLGKSNLTDLRLGDWKSISLAVLFADIRGFTALSETMTPEENFRFINSYLSRTGPLIRKHKGFIDKYIGDGIMALFPRSAQNALDAAIAMQKEMQVYNRHRANCGYSPVRIGIGIHFGDTIIGTIGENERIEVTVISDTVNVASRLESLSKRYGAGILVSGDVVAQLQKKKKFRLRYTDRVRAKGKQSPIDIYEVLDGLAAEELGIKLKNRPILQKALKTYLAAEPAKAADLLLKLRDTLPLDKAAQVLSEKISHYMSQPAEARGDTVETLYE